MKQPKALVLACVGLLGWVVPVQAAGIRVFAAASLSDSLEEIGALYQKETGDKLIFNFAGSGVLARQIEEGAPADLFFSADEIKMDELASRGLLVQGSRRSLLSNLLVLVTMKDRTAVRAPADLAGPAVRRIALGNTRTVPAGSYAKAYFQNLQLWRVIEPKVIPCENVRAVLAAVESGNVDAGMVYKTDATISGKVRVAFEVPAAEGPKISYPVALLKDAPSAEQAKKFVGYLQGKEARAVFTRRGFITLASRNSP